MTPTEEIKEKIDLLDFLKGYLKISKAGKSYKAVCPFHKEKTPSFMISPERQIWRCFGCGEGGDIFKFLMRYENIEFYEALRILAEKAGVDIGKRSSADQRRFNLLYEIVKDAADMYKEELRVSDKAKEYLKSRNLTGKTAAEFELGYAPTGTDELTMRLVNKGYRVEDVLTAGIAFKTDRGKYVDRFRGRIMFPIHNHFGRVVGFSGRILPELDTGEMGKYINSPETPIFNKSRLLYGYWKSKNPIREVNRAIFVEGQMDFLALWQAGFQNVVGTSGTALTNDHLAVIRRTADDLVLAFDNDEAGVRAAHKAIDEAGAQDFNVYFLNLGGNKDPADMVEKDVGSFKEALDNVQPAMNYYFQHFLENADGVSQKKKGVSQVLGKISRLASKVEQNYWLDELSNMVGLSKEDLMKEVERLELGGAPTESTGEKIEIKRPTLTKRELISERLVYLAYVHEELRPELEELLSLVPKVYVEIYKALKEGKALEGRAGELMEFISMYPTFESVYTFGFSPEREFSDLIEGLKLYVLNEQKEKLRKEILWAEKSGNEKTVSEKLKQFDELSRKMQHIKHAKS